MVGMRGLVALAVAAMVGMYSLAQEKPKDAPRPVGTKRWVVIKSPDSDFTGKSDQRVADFDTEADAEKEARRLREAEREWWKWSYTVRGPGGDGPGDPALEQNTPKGKITNPDLKSADPGAMKTGEKWVPSLAGRTATGTIGKAKVTIQFTGTEAGGEFVVSGAAEGRGRRRQLCKFVLLQTERSKFEGTLDADKLGGTRRLKEGGEKDEWSVKLVPNSGEKAFYPEKRELWAGQDWSKWGFFLSPIGTELGVGPFTLGRVDG